MPRPPKKKTAKKRAPRKSKRQQTAPASEPVESGMESSEQREVVYPDIDVKGCIDDEALTAHDAELILGWREESENVKFGNNYLFKDIEGKKIQCFRNVGNRPYNHRRTLAYCQDILTGRWQLNGHPRIISKYDTILSGQHVLPALVLAVQQWRKHPGKWPHWNTEPTIETLIVYGIDDSDAVKNTIDTARETKLHDVLYRTSHLEDVLPADRGRVARLAAWAVKCLWNRTAARNDAYAPIDTLSESVEFLNRHYRLLECARFMAENEGVKRFIGPGTAAGLMYLMGCSGSDPDVYYPQDSREENVLDWSLKDKAEDFWVLLADNDSKEMAAVRKAREAMALLPGAERQAEKEALIIKAWLRYADGKPLTATALKLKYNEAESPEYRPTLAETPLIGGIDIGSPEEEEPEPATESTPKPARKPRPKKLRPHRAGDQWAAGDVAYVIDNDGESYIGTIQEGPWEVDDREPHVLVLPAGEEDKPTNRDTVEITQLRLEVPA